MRVLIADSGSTKCDWQLLDASGKELMEFHTMGFNPYFHSADKVQEVMSAHADVDAIKEGVTHVFFYGAGSSSAALCTVIEEGLQRVFNQAKVTVDHDLWVQRTAPTTEGLASLASLAQDPTVVISTVQM